ncbi:transposase family protein [Streptomyces botrytidirepellens]|uniref:transposase family protein n=1 Tax=Streptomyces botrytidirepellens TaxID=2486417 RepID=UPI001C831947|nr:transposase family protein [Streptomyces botrytidirepellens]
MGNLRHGTTHDVLACWFGADRSTTMRTFGGVRPLPAQRGCTVTSGVRLRTLAEVIEHLGASDQTNIIATTGRVVTPPHSKVKKNARAWYEEMHKRQRKPLRLPKNQSDLVGALWVAPRTSPDAVRPPDLARLSIVTK